MLRLVLMYVLRIQNTVFKSHRRRMEMATLVFQPIRPPHRYVNGEMGKIFVCYCHCFLFNILALYSFGPISQAKRRRGRPRKSSQTPPPPQTVSQVIISYYIHFVVLFSFLILPFYYY